MQDFSEDIDRRGSIALTQNKFGCDAAIWIARVLSVPYINDSFCLFSWLSSGQWLAKSGQTVKNKQFNQLNVSYQASACLYWACFYCIANQSVCCVLACYFMLCAFICRSWTCIVFMSYFMSILCMVIRSEKLFQSFQLSLLTIIVEGLYSSNVSIIHYNISAVSLVSCLHPAVF